MVPIEIFPMCHDSVRQITVMQTSKLKVTEADSKASSMSTIEIFHFYLHGEYVLPNISLNPAIMS